MAGKKKTELTPEEMLERLQVDYIKERQHWEFIHQYGCQDPFWEDGVNLNLTRNHCIHDKEQMEDICKEYSLPMPKLPSLPDEIDMEYMAPYGRFPNRLLKSRPQESFQLSLELF